MDKQELLMELVHQRMEAIAKLNVLRALGIHRFNKQIDALLDRLNYIDAIIKEIEKNK